jgi:phage terminase Nu1 subunit (DNA packaging protein)
MRPARRRRSALSGRASRSRARNRPASLTQERTLLVRAQREKAELGLAERRGELQSRAENEEKAAMLATDARKRLLAVPERVAGRFGLPREVIEGIAEEIRDALVELSTMGEP